MKRKKLDLRIEELSKAILAGNYPTPAPGSAVIPKCEGHNLPGGGCKRCGINPRWAN